MRRIMAVAIWWATCGLMTPAVAAPAEGLDVPMTDGLVTVLIRFGVNAKAPATWDGTYELSAGRIIATDGWRFAADDYATLTKFRLDVRRNFPLFWRMQGRDPKSLPVEPNGLLLTMADLAKSSTLTIKTEQGTFPVPVGELGMCERMPRLRGTVEVCRVPTARLVVKSPTEDYMPAAAATKNGMAVAYLAFTHGEGFAVRAPVKTPMKDFAPLGKPTGGDRLMFTELKAGRWSKPEPLTPAGGDLFTPAVAVDGGGRVWVFWSANVKGNWDLYARVRGGGSWSKPVRLTTDEGSDVFPVAVTDAKGNVHVAWQGWRGGNAEIFWARQEGGAFGKPQAAGGGKGNQWAPALAAAADGTVALAWDSYERGEYDVTVRLWRDGAWQAPMPAAADRTNEARPSIAFDGQGRLWVAYEISPEGWGKDFGPYDQAPIRMPLYRNRKVGVRVLSAGRWYQPASDVNQAFPSPIGKRRWPKMPKNQVLLAGPRIAVDGRGRVWLTARVRMARFISGVGTAWTNFLTTLDGGQWRPATVVPNNDGLLHESPVLLPLAGGGLRLVSTCDGRMRSAPMFSNMVQKLRRRSKKAPPATTRTYGQYPDWWANWEIAAAETAPERRGDGPKLVNVDPAKDEATSPSPGAVAEAKAVQAIREYRVTLGGKELRLWRGEFHRHTEISADGGGDGTIFDMWRYAIDMASMDWLGFGDHDNGGGREFPWWLSQKTTDVFLSRGAFTPMFTYERSCNYPDGHRNAVFAKRGVRTLPRLRGGMGKAMDDLPPDAKRPHTPDTQMFYRYLHYFDGVCASHTSGTNMGTDWRDNDPKVEPVVEIYQGDRQNYERPGAPRTNTAQYSLGGWRPLGFVSRALRMGYRLGFQSSSDHISTHMSYCNVWVENPTRANILDALKKRRVYGSTDNIIADVRCVARGSTDGKEHFMGEEFTLAGKPTLKVNLIGTAPFARVVVVKDNQYVYSIEPKKRHVTFTWTDMNATPGKTSYYYVRGLQVGTTVKKKVHNRDTGRAEVELNNGEIVWVSPMWITVKK